MTLLYIFIYFTLPRICEASHIKGKIERYWKTVQDSFIPEIKRQHIKSLSELNDLYFAWKKTEYENKLHSSIG
ncbi:MAG: transposase, partial [Clostridiales bacterium]|nr:transposase [Clostridiales bacterium]